jgi:hypothetical protein
MEANVRFLRWFYGLLLTFYPRNYREEYGDELQSVFHLLLDEALKTGGWELAKVVLRELSGLPKAVVLEHLRERRKTKMIRKLSSPYDFEPGSRNEIFAALAPFLLFGALPTLLGYFRVWGAIAVPLWLDIMFVIVFWLLGLSLLVMGFARGVPRWFMPYLGLPLPLLSVYGFLDLFSTLIEFPLKLYDKSWYVGQLFYQGYLWIGLIFLVPIFVLLIALIPRFRPFYRRIREDWTLLAFILYGSAPFALVLTFDDYQNEEPYKFLSFLILAAGAWFYLRNSVPSRRFWSLFLGLALSMFTAAVGKAILYAGTWPRPKYFTWQTEMASTLIMWIWLALIMLLPLAINLLPRANAPPQAAEAIRQ